MIPGRRRAFLLVMALMLVVLLLVVGLAFLGQKALQYRSASQTQLNVQAKALAEAGLEDFRLKLERDLDFPPMAEDGGSYAYREEVKVGSTVVGSYAVTIDNSYSSLPYGIVVVTSLGEAGSSSQQAVARRALRIEVDIARKQRDDPALDNPTYRKVTSYQDLGSP